MSTTLGRLCWVMQSCCKAADICHECYRLLSLITDQVAVMAQVVNRAAISINITTSHTPGDSGSQASVINCHAHDMLHPEPLSLAELLVLVQHISDKSSIQPSSLLKGLLGFS